MKNSPFALPLFPGHTWRAAIALSLCLVVSCPASFAADSAEEPPAEEETEPLLNTDCLDCHAEAEVKIVEGTEIPLEALDAERFDASVHGILDCIDCHNGITELIHDSNPPPAQCADCHDVAAEEYLTGIHGMSHSMGASAAATCADCHGSHYILPVSDPESAVYKMNQPATCSRCHSNPVLTSDYQMKDPEGAAHYLDSIHGYALLKAGLIVAPSCVDCHGVHNIKRSVDRDAPIHRTNISKTCGKCHVTVEAIYNQSIHGQLSLQGDAEGPVCTDCHTAHEIEPPANGHFKRVSDQRCGRCHQDRLDRYHETYHGKAMELGKPNVAAEVAACFDCHGHHDVLPHSDPNSRLSSENIVQTCGTCHPGATIGFTQYLPHADPHDGENYPGLHLVFLLMTGLLISVFTVFGAHTLLWLVRSLYLYRHDSKTFREAKVKASADDEWFRRFVPFERFLHFLVVTSFLLLVLTGMPLKFYYAGWAKWLFGWMGGPDVAQWLHRFAAVITFLYFGLHIMALVKRIWKGRKNLRDANTGKFRLSQIKAAIFSPDSMIPTWQDWHDFVAHQKWFFGKGPKPQFDRWTYWEKFDYFAVFWGVFIIGMSGLVLWIPQFFTQFLPGWIINVAVIIHSDEALLAAGFIFTIHFFNTHFRIEKWPMDTVIFSGRISKTELLHERKRWHDRLVAEGRLDDYRVKDEWEQTQRIARSFGYLFFGLGVILLFLIIYAMVTHLIH